METALTLSSIAAMSGVMIVGASIPSISALAVAARSAAFGFAHGLATAAGIVVGDVVFILIAIYGLSILAELMGGQFALVRYLGASYLIGLGVMLWRSRPSGRWVETAGAASRTSSFLTGLLITLGDQKAILFYLGIFPALLDLSRLSALDTGMIVMAAIVTVGGPKLGYALAADRARRVLGDTLAATAMNRAAGSVLIGVGVLLIAHGFE